MRPHLERPRTSEESTVTYCFECKRPLTEIDNYGQRLKGPMGSLPNPGGACRADSPDRDHLVHINPTARRWPAMLPRGNDEPKKAAANGGLGASLRNMQTQRGHEIESPQPPITPGLSCMNLLLNLVGAVGLRTYDPLIKSSAALPPELCARRLGRQATGPSEPPPYQKPARSVYGLSLAGSAPHAMRANIGPRSLPSKTIQRVNFVAEMAPPSVFGRKLQIGAV